MAKNNKTKKKKTKSKKLNQKQITAIIALVVFLAIIISGVIVTIISAGSKESYEFQEEVSQGIDVSSHNGKINWSKAKDEIDFAFIRVGYRGYANGKIMLDKQCKRNLKNANENSVPVGVYFYSQATTVEEAEQEAEFALKAVKHYDIGLPIAIDFEYASLKNGALGGRLFDANLSQKETTDIINAFCKKVELAGYKPACYASSSVYKTKINTKKLNEGICIWVADYNESVTYNGYYDIWQYSQTGKCKGVKSKYVDLDYWYLRK